MTITNRYKVVGFVDKNGNDCGQEDATIMIAIDIDTERLLPFTVKIVNGISLSINDGFTVTSRYQRN